MWTVYHRGRSGVAYEVVAAVVVDAVTSFLVIRMTALSALSSLSLASGVYRCSGTSGRAGKWSEDDEGL